ncbi:hypothetical protein LO762_17095 [Actinocorallia sp. API 0066]|uniref:hypothetical protein n=1 Tax=Actinocorallia sp. API 0066 TaxID=2896846 RepID=UPI001E4578E5|nr:hypothetical protein [Actinocorallia sp. API 0066]MCD0450898.1 hypothetical protein [Actinocorallia sp. API 0066]
MVRLSREGVAQDEARRTRRRQAAALEREIRGARVWWGDACGTWFGFVAGPTRATDRLVEASSLGRLRELMLAPPQAGTAWRVAGRY